jgi:ZIP family zinc transporter
MIIFISIAAFLSTLLGGMFALRFKDKLHLVLGFSAGAVIGVAFFDLLPEALELGARQFSVTSQLSVVALGFFAYLLLDRLIFFRTHAHDHGDSSHPHSHRSSLGASALILHSFLDGLAIGLAFQVSSAVGWVVAVAVLVHDFSDGINTVGYILKSGASGIRAKSWLFVDALAPVLGAGSTLFFTVPQAALAIILSLFAGFFLYIGASDLIPESHHGHPRFLTTVMTLLGALVLFIAIRCIGA